MAIFHNPTAPLALSLRVLSHLLRYPGADLHAGLDELQQALHAEGALSRSRLADLDALVHRLRSAPPLDSEAAYVELFDRGRSTALHLFEHVLGDSRERGPAMIDLARTYEQAGLYLDAGELPDHLSVVLEYASTQPPAQAREFLRELAHILQAIFSALQQRRSPYAAVLAALLDLAGEPARLVKPAPEPPLDESWAEPPAFDGCASAGQARPGQPQPVQIVRRPAASQGSPQGANP